MGFSRILLIISLAFANDILLFCRGDQMSVELMMGTFKKFSDSTGLIFNLRKCSVLFGCVDNETMSSIKAVIGFDEGHFPVIYLGVPLSSKKINFLHYLPLIDKITGRIQHWSTKLLSYAGRVQLVRSIVCSVAQFWMLNFPLPKAIIKRIDAVCRSLIWNGKADVSKKSHVA